MKPMDKLKLLLPPRCNLFSIVAFWDNYICLGRGVRKPPYAGLINPRINSKNQCDIEPRCPSSHQKVS